MGYRVEKYAVRKGPRLEINFKILEISKPPSGGLGVEKSYTGVWGSKKVTPEFNFKILEFSKPPSGGSGVREDGACKLLKASVIGFGDRE